MYTKFAATVLTLIALSGCGSVGELFKECGCDRGQICVLDPWDETISTADNAQDNGTCTDVPVACSRMFTDDVLEQDAMDDDCRDALCPTADAVSGSSIQGGEHYAFCEYNPPS